MPTQKSSGNPPQCCRRAIVNGREQLIFETSSGQRITLQEAPPEVLIEDGNGNSVKLEAGGVTVNAAAKISLNAAVIEISAGTLTVNAAIAKFSGVVQADTIMATSVIEPGSGNVW
jgi:hypothetical protein